MTKKKEDIGIEKWSVDMDEQIKDSLKLVWKIKPAVIDTPAIVRLTEVPMKDPIMNMLCYMMTGKDLDDL